MRAPFNPPTTATTEVDELRARVLRLGGLLGWPSADVIVFAEGVTRRPWECCGPTELVVVVDEFRDLAAAIATRRARRTCGGEDAHGARAAA